MAEWKRVVFDLHHALNVPFGENIYGRIEELQRAALQQPAQPDRTTP